MGYCSLDDSIKRFRRGTHAYQKEWRGFVLCKTVLGMQMHFDEIKRQLAGSSVGLKQANHTTRTLTTNKGSTLTFGVIEDKGAAETSLKGREFTQIMFLYRPDDDVIIRAQGALRSPFVPPEQYRLDIIHDS